MDHVNDDDILQLAKHDTVATLVPGANYFLGLKEYPDARRLIDAGVPVALATDYNPGTSPTVSMPMAMSLACTHMKMSPGGSDRSGYDQWGMGASLGGAQRQHRAGQGCGFSSI